MAKQPHREHSRLAIAMVVAAIVISASILVSYGSHSTVTSTSTATSTTTSTVTDTLSQTSTVSQTTTATTTVTSTVTASLSGPPLLEANQVVLIDVASPAAPGDWGSISPSNVRLVVGVNNTVLFVNSGKNNVAVASIIWPTNSSGFSTPILTSSENYSISLSTPGLYNYTDYIHPTGVSGLILVVDVPGISASTSSNDTVSIGNLLLCTTCNPGPSLHASVLISGTSPLADLSLYLNGTSEGRTFVNDNMTSYAYQYSANLVDSYTPIQQEKTYFVEIVAVFADDQLAVSTASVVAT